MCVPAVQNYVPNKIEAILESVDGGKDYLDKYTCHALLPYTRGRNGVREGGRGGAGSGAHPYQ